MGGACASKPSDTSDLHRVATSDAQNSSAVLVQSAAYHDPPSPNVLSVEDMLGMSQIVRCTQSAKITNEHGKRCVNGYTIQEDLKLGNGTGAGHVYQCTDSSGASYAMRILLRSKVGKHWELEKRVLETVAHPNIVDTILIVDDPQQPEIYVVNELLGGGPVVSIGTPLNEASAKRYFRDIVEALRALHSMGFAHCDIKPENILTDKRRRVAKIIDFGSCTDVLYGTNTCKSTAAFLPPEAVDACGWSFSWIDADFWAAAATLYTMVVGSLPFEGDGPEGLNKNICSEQLKAFPSSVSEPLCHLLRGMLVKEPKKRISPVEALQSEWMMLSDNPFCVVDSETKKVVQNFCRSNKALNPRRPAVALHAEKAPQSCVSYTILVVDDDAEKRRVLVGLLSSAVDRTLCQIVEAESWMEAVAMHQEYETDWVLLDVHAGGISAFNVVAKMRTFENKSAVGVPSIITVMAPLRLLVALEHDAKDSWINDLIPEDLSALKVVDLCIAYGVPLQPDAGMSSITSPVEARPQVQLSPEQRLTIHSEDQKQWLEAHKSDNTATPEVKRLLAMIAVLPPTSPPLSDVPSVDSNSKLDFHSPVNERGPPTLRHSAHQPKYDVLTKLPAKLVRKAHRMLCVSYLQEHVQCPPILSLEAVRDAVSLELPKDLATAATFDFAHLREVVASNAEKISSAVNTNPIPDTVWMPSHSLFYLAGSSGFRANHNEDKHFVLSFPSTLRKNNRVAGREFLAAVFDGHGGEEASTFASLFFADFFVNHPDFQADPAAALEAAFRRTHGEFIKLAQDADCHSGTTALALYIRENTLYVAHVGDCEAVAYFDGAVQTLNRKHTCDVPQEQEQIRRNNGEVVLVEGAWRVNGMLAVSRALGDLQLQQYISCVPEIVKINLTPYTDPQRGSTSYSPSALKNFVILGSDGLWSAYEKQELCNFVSSVMVEGLLAKSKVSTMLAYEEVLPVLMEEAGNRSRRDDISVVVVFF